MGKEKPKKDEKVETPRRYGRFGHADDLLRYERTLQASRDYVKERFGWLFGEDYRNVCMVIFANTLERLEELELRIKEVEGVDRGLKEVSADLKNLQDNVKS